MCLLLAAALGSYALVHGGSSGSLDFASSSGQQLTAYACVASGKVSDVTVASAPDCSAQAQSVRWLVPSRTVGLSGHNVTVYGCLKYGSPTQVSVASATKCQAKTTPAHWGAKFGKNVLSGQGATVYACLAWGGLTHVSVASASKCPAGTIAAHWPAWFLSPSSPGSSTGPSTGASDPSTGTTSSPATSTATATATSPSTGSSSSMTTSPATGSSSTATTSPATGSSSSTHPTTGSSSSTTTTTSPATGSSSSTHPATGSSSSTHPATGSSSSTHPATGSSSTTTTSPATGSSSSSSTATTAAPSGNACVTSDLQGGCGPYPNFSGITTANNDNNNGSRVIQNVWNPISGTSQKLTSNNPGSWNVQANMPASNKSVVSYPDVQQVFTVTSGAPNPLTNFKSITSSYSESAPQTGDWEAAYDIWAGTSVNDPGSLEIMIWVDNHGQVPAGTKVASTTINGQSYSVWSAGKTPVSLVLDSNQSSGTIDILGAMNYLKSAGYIPSNTGVNQIDFGWEICNTGGSTQTFSMNSYTLKAS